MKQGESNTNEKEKDLEKIRKEKRKKILEYMRNLDPEEKKILEEEVNKENNINIDNDKQNGIQNEVQHLENKQKKLEEERIKKRELKKYQRYLEYNDIDEFVLNYLDVKNLLPIVYDYHNYQNIDFLPTNELLKLYDRIKKNMDDLYNNNLAEKSFNIIIKNITDIFNKVKTLKNNIINYYYEKGIDKSIVSGFKYLYSIITNINIFLQSIPLNIIIISYDQIIIPDFLYITNVLEQDLYGNVISNKYKIFFSPDENYSFKQIENDKDLYINFIQRLKNKLWIDAIDDCLNYLDYFYKVIDKIQYKYVARTKGYFFDYKNFLDNIKNMLKNKGVDFKDEEIQLFKPIKKYISFYLPTTDDVFLSSKTISTLFQYFYNIYDEYFLYKLNERFADNYFIKRESDNKLSIRISNVIKTIENEYKTDENINTFKQIDLIFDGILSIEEKFKEINTNHLIFTVIYYLKELDNKNSCIDINDIKTNRLWCKYYTYKQFINSIKNKKEDLINLIEDGQYDELNDYDYSKEVTLPNLFSINFIQIIYVSEDVTKIKRCDGNVFEYYINPEFNYLAPYLSKYQIYPLNYDFSNDENCFIHSLRQTKLIDENTINQISKKLIDINVAFTTIRDIADEFDLNIKISTKKETLNYNKKGKIKINLYCYRGKYYSHYMIQEKTLFSKDYFNHIYQYLNNPKYFNHDGREKSLMLTSKLIPLLIEKGIVRMLSSDKVHENVSSLLTNLRITLPNDLRSQSRALLYKQYTKKKESFKEELIFADCECYIDENGEHIPFCICFISEYNDIERYFYGEDCLIRFVYYLTQFDTKPIVIFHNLSYDGRLFKNFFISEMIKKDSKIYQMKIFINDDKAKNKTITLKDSYCMIHISISKFNDYFKLGEKYKKDIFPYMYYSHDTLYKGKIENCWKDEIPKWDDKKIYQFKENLKELNAIIDNDYFDTEKYCLFYCKQDVRILKIGYQKFRSIVEKELNLDLTKSLTISGLAYKYMKIHAFCPNDVEEQIILCEYKLSLRDWIRQGIKGGRCMSRDNKKWDIKGKIQDYDACSLYPSAMKRLYLPSGCPRLLKEEEYNWEYLNLHTMLEDQIDPTKEKYISNYMVEINIIGIGQERHFPLIMKKDKNNINQNINKLTKMIVDNIYLEDLIKYQGIEFEILSGICWEGKKSPYLSKTIEYVYNLRKEKKAKGDLSEIIYKEIMNSSYGKTIQKPILTELIFKYNEDDVLKYMTINNTHIKSVDKISDNCYIIEKKVKTDDYYIPCIIGVLILSMSKRIMNELICLAEDINCNVYYQDTDSIHIEENDLIKLEKAYKEKYNREIKGNNMGQFHSDFPPVNGKSSWSIRSIILGKKMYLDILTNENNDINYHIRLKGIPEDCIKGTAKEMFPNEKDGHEIVKLYEYLYNGNEVIFDLLKFKQRFKMEKDMTIHNLAEFKRKIKIN